MPVRSLPARHVLMGSHIMNAQDEEDFVFACFCAYQVFALARRPAAVSEREGQSAADRKKVKKAYVGSQVIRRQKAPESSAPKMSTLSRTILYIPSEVRLAVLLE